MGRISKGLSGIFLRRKACLESVVEGVGVSDGVAERLAEVSSGAAVRSRGVAALSFHSLVVFHDPFAGAVVQQVVRSDPRSVWGNHLHADEGSDASKGDPIQCFNGSQLIHGVKGAIPQAIGEDGVDLKV